MRKNLADVVVLAGIPKKLTYQVSEAQHALVGSRVLVPVKTMRKVGIVVSLYEGDVAKVKSIAAILDDNPLITGELIDLLQWCSRYYHAGIGATLALALPPYLRQARAIPPDTEAVLYRTPAGTGRIGSKQRDIIEAIPEEGISAERLRKIFPGSSSSISSLIEKGYLKRLEEPFKPAQSHESTPPPDYTGDQAAAISALCDDVASHRFKTIILHGITGSGKTEVYLAGATQALSMGLSVLYLVPEIALTPQTVAMIQNRIPSEIAVFHSGLSPKARLEEFMKVSCDKVHFVLGTRSAIFAPLKNLGLIVVDEEHDHSYKQEDGVPYNARDLAILRARNNDAVVILGSATPSMDTFSRAGTGNTHLITMSQRTGGAVLPRIEIVDMRGVQGSLSERLQNAIVDTVARQEQVLLFINRRGFSSAMVCPGCGQTLTCSHCATSLTYHKARGIALCHYCGFSIHLPEICPSCGCLDMKPIGLGTEQITQAVQHCLPDVRILKMDSDEITTTKKLASALQAIRNHDVDIIVGTQMIAKGHDFPRLTLVGVMHAEQLLFLPDFRAGERTYQQIVQVAGRAGRRLSDTRVIIQTLIPEHPLIQSIAAYDYEGMLASEEKTRREAGFPPFSYMARCVFSSPDNDAVKQVIHLAAAKISRPDIDILGPAPAPIPFLRNRHRWHILIRSADRKHVHQAIDSLLKMNIPSQVHCKIDVDPYSML